MKEIPELQEDRAHLIRSAEDIVHKADQGDRNITVEEDGEIKRLMEESGQLDKEIESRQRHEEQRASIASRLDSLNKQSDGRPEPTKPADNTDPTAPAAQPEHIRVRSSRLKGFKGPDGERVAHRCGRWFQSELFGNAEAKRWCQQHGMFEQRALAEGINTAGGHLVPEEFLAVMIDLREDYGSFRQNCRVIPMGRDTMDIPRLTATATPTFTGENVAATESDVTFDLVTLTAKKLTNITRVPSELAEDSAIDLADFLAMDFARGFALKEDQCGWTGDGTATYGGMQGLSTILTGTSGLASAVDAPATIDTFAEVTAAALANVMGVIPIYARANAKWYCSAVAYDVVFGRLMGAAGGNTIQNMEGGYGPSYLGSPIVLCQVLPTTTGAQDEEAMLYFGDLSLAATMGERRGIDVQISTERYFPEDQIAIRAIERFDINVHDYGDATTAGPIAALIGETT